MGDRALVIFHYRECVSPVVYLHWNGREVPAWLNDLREIMRGRESDVDYACARFIGLCHARIDGNLSLGVANLPKMIADLIILPKRPEERNRTLTQYSHGNAGLVLVNASDFTWVAFGGYLAE